jgi:hypothetical protein
MRNKRVARKKSMQVTDFIDKLKEAIGSLDQSNVETELRDYFPRNHLPGLDNRIKTGIATVINYLEKMVAQAHLN